MLLNLTKGCLLVVSIGNVMTSMSFMLDVSMIPYVEIVMKLLAVVELGLYVVVPASLPLWMVHKMIMKRQKNI